jgi:hypothetical protein
MAAARARVRPATPIALAQRLVGGRYRTTPSLALISDLLLDSITGDDRRLIISCAPRTGKTLLGAVITPVFCLARDPDASIIVAAHGDELATESSREARRLITEHKDLLGISLAADAGAVGRWRVAGHRGGLWAGAVTGGPVGFGVSRTGILIVDDPVRGAVEADSAAYRRRLYTEFKVALLSRLEPGASCIVLSSRWSEHDLAGQLLAEPGSPWQLINIPAVATAGVFDSLGREPGAPVTNALGRDAAGWAEIRRAVGERTWAAMYLGAPSTPAGALIQRSWIDDHRAPAAPVAPSSIVVAVDPAEGGSATGDKTGIVAAALGRDHRVYLISDASAVLSSDAWANRAAQLAITLGASAIHVEAFQSGVTYTRLISEAIARQAPPHRISVSAWPPRGSGRGRGDAMTRAAGMLAGLENGSCVVGGHLPDLEADMTGWQAHQHCPDAVAAATICFDVLSHSAAGQGVTFIAPTAARLGGGGGVPASRMRGGGMPGRSTVVPIDEALAYRRQLGRVPGGRTGRYR